MKHLFYLFMVVLSCTLWNCSKSSNQIDEPDDPDTPNQTEIRLDISTSDLVFEAKGGEKEFTIYSNTDWTITNESEWCTTDITKGKDNSKITVIVEDNPEMEDRNTSLIIKAGDKTEELTVTQKHRDKEETITMVTEQREITSLVVFCFKKDNIITVNWGDGTVEEFKSNGREFSMNYGPKYNYNFRCYVLDTLKHQYNSDNPHTITINGSISGLNCANNSLTSLDVSKCTELIWLECWSNWGKKFTSLDVSKCTKLIYLDCTFNNLTSLDVSGCTALTKLDCSTSNLTSLDVSGCTKLTELWCYSSKLTSLDISGCTELYCLNCANNSLTSLDVSKCTKLTELDCENNNLTSLDVSKHTELNYLYCGNNNLTSLDVSKDSRLFYLQCGRNNLSAEALNKIFTNLPKGREWTDEEYYLVSVDHSTIRIGDNPGTNTCNKNIAENKGWIIEEILNN